MDKSAPELKGFVLQMFDSKNWESFTRRNFATFPRYVRDQCLEAKRYFFHQDIDHDILEEALKYCLENDTLSIAWRMIRSVFPTYMIPTLTFTGNPGTATTGVQLPGYT